MKLIYSFTLFIIMCSSINIFGQNYQCFRSDREYLYTNEREVINGLKFDSTIFYNDSILFPFENIQEIDMDCYSPSGPSWIGQKVIIKSDGYNYFLNKRNDTIKIKTNALLNESWNCYQLEELKITASVNKIEWLNFLQINDSVKEFRFQAYDQNNEQIDHWINNKSLKLSKNYGFVIALNFYLFPDLEKPIFEDYLNEHQLSGLTNPSIGVENLTWKKVHDYEIGDEFHSIYSGSMFLFTLDSILTIKRIVDKEIVGDTCIYSCEQKHLKIVNQTDTNYSIIWQDTVVIKASDHPNFDKLSNETVIGLDYAFSYTMKNDNWLSKTEPSIYETIVPNEGDCWGFLFADGCFPAYTYYKGKGGPYFECSSFVFLQEEKNQLVYYKKGDEEWGEPVSIIVSTNEINNQPFFDVFPNPSKLTINFRTNSENIPYTLKIFTMDGKLVFQDKVDSPNYLYMNNQQNGLYIYNIYYQRGKFVSGKIIFN